jgi:cobalt-zinc-cadmium efflux system membrane fusion protein
VLERKATTGQIIQPAETVFVLADLTNTWLVADLPEQIAGNIEPDRIVEAEISALPGHIVRGRLSHVSPIVDPETRTVRTRMNLPNPNRRYKPAMLATIVLKDEAAQRRVVPASAVVRENNRDHVFVQTAPETFLLRPVELDEAGEGRRVVISGIGDDEKIVLDGAFHLNNERNRLALQGE